MLIWPTCSHHAGHGAGLHLRERPSLFGPLIVASLLVWFKQYFKHAVERYPAAVERMTQTRRVSEGLLE